MAEEKRTGGMNVAKYAARTIDSYEKNKRTMPAEDARRVTLSAIPAAQRDESRLKGQDAHQFEMAAFKVGQTTLDIYTERLEHYPAGKARAAAVGIAADFYNDRAEPKQPRGTLDVKAFAARVIDQYVFMAELHGRTAARQSTTYATSTTAEANGVNGTRAARLADASINEYERLGAKGAPHDLARNAAVRKMAERYDEQAYDRAKQRERGRGRGGMER